MKICDTCRSYAINIDPDGKLCDVCYLKRDVARLTALVESVVEFCKTNQEHCDPFCCGEYLTEISELVAKGLKNE